MQPEDFLTQLRRVNSERAEEWMQGTASDPLFWATEFGGEAGEVLNEVKKLRRAELGWVGSTTDLSKLSNEIGDAIISLDAIARHYGIDMQDAVIGKFNLTSEKHGFTHKLERN